MNLPILLVLLLALDQGFYRGYPKFIKVIYLLDLFLSALGTINYKVSKNVIPLLKEIAVSQSTIQNTFTFVKDLIEIPCANEYILASFNFINQFTNVPQGETIDIIMNTLFSKTDKISWFNKMYFKKHTQERYFILV